MRAGMERRAPAGQGQQRAGSMLPPIPRLPNPPLAAGTHTTSQSQRAAACTVQPWQQSQRPPLNAPRQQAGTPSLGSSARDVIIGSRPVTPPLRPAAPSQQWQHRVTAGQSSPSSQRLVAQGATCALPSADDAMVGGREVPVEIAPDGLPYLPMQLGSPATPEERGTHASVHGVLMVRLVYTLSMPVSIGLYLQLTAYPCRREVAAGIRGDSRSRPGAGSVRGCPPAAGRPWQCQRRCCRKRCCCSC